MNRPDELYHVTVMPCYDKKLEAARDDFVFELEHPTENDMHVDPRVAEVDSVLTSGEVLELIQVKEENISCYFHYFWSGPMSLMIASVFLIFSMAVKVGGF